jgi:hypothetical protein
MVVGEVKELLFSPKRPSCSLAHPTSIVWVPGTLSHWLKRLESEADHLPPSSIKVKKE